MSLFPKKKKKKVVYPFNMQNCFYMTCQSVNNIKCVLWSGSTGSGSQSTR